MLQAQTCVSVHCDQCGDSPYSPGPDLEAHWPTEDAALTAAAAAGWHLGHRPPRLLCRDCGTVLRCQARGHEFTGWRRCRCEQLVAAHRPGPVGLCAMALRYCLRCSVLESRPEVPLLPCGCPECGRPVELIGAPGHQSTTATCRDADTCGRSGPEGESGASSAAPTPLPPWQADRLATLLDALGAVPVSDAERASLTWLCGFEADTVEKIAAVTYRARDRSSLLAAQWASEAMARLGRQLSAARDEVFSRHLEADRYRLQLVDLCGHEGIDPGEDPHAALLAHRRGREPGREQS